MRDVDLHDFNQTLREASGLVLADLWAPWCGPCQAVTPTLESLEPDYDERLTFCKVNVEEVPELMRAFQLRSIPAVLLLQPKEGGGARVVDAMIGARPRQVYVKWLDKHLNPRPSLWARLTGRGN